ncbi:MAG: mannose-6-phosphate isomerase, class I [Spirochaetaceae bacterium]|nr:MAG: mannose-6-phosphate isomerase, class I [Spirochaetaceae bacterium]
MESLVAEVFRLINTVQEYAWGSRTAIPELLGQPSPADKPQAELWMGAHPKAPSQVLLPNDGQIALPELITRNPARILGAAVAEKYSGRLPFLFKVLAAAEPLSIQAHPNLDQAQAGFRRENEQGISLDAFRRNYRDANHKPEVISALTPFWALNGFRPIPEILDLLRLVKFVSIGNQVAAFGSNPTAGGLKALFAALMGLDQEIRERLIEEALDWAHRQLKGEETHNGLPAGIGSGSMRAGEQTASIARWLLRLEELYPGDIGVLAPLLLNLVLLQPGDTMFLEAGVLHAYLEGTGIELMANSDNVIRGGLTPKHVDVQELLSILRFEGRAIRLAEAIETVPGLRTFQTPAEEFRLAEIRVHAQQPYRHPGTDSIELMIVLHGEGRIEAKGELALRQGDSLLIPASTGPYTIAGSLQLYKAFVPR